MALHNKLPPFDPKARFLVKRAFSLNGRDLLPGDAVTAEDFTGGARRLRLLYHSRWVVMEGTLNATVAPGQAAGRSGRLPPPVEPSSTPPAVTPAPAPPGADLAIMHRGGGRWVVTRAGKIVTGYMEKPHAEAIASGAIPLPDQDPSGKGEGDGEGGENDGEDDKPPGADS